MSVKKKISENSINQFIAKGAEVKKEKKLWTKICLRIPSAMLDQIDEKVDKKIGFNRTSWILSALEKQMKWEI